MGIAIGLAVVSILLTTISQAMIRHGMVRVGSVLFPLDKFFGSMREVVTEPFVIGGFVLIALAVPMWLEVLARLPLSIAYPLVSIGFIFTLVIGALFLKESITPMKLAGVAIIFVGVLALSKS